jgi:hypothetical protein
MVSFGSMAVYTVMNKDLLECMIDVKTGRLAYVFVLIYMMILSAQIKRELSTASLRSSYLGFIQTFRLNTRHERDNQTTTPNILFWGDADSRHYDKNIVKSSANEFISQ